MSRTVELHADTITLDAVSATAIAEHDRPLVIAGRCYVTRERVDGQRVLSLRIEAAHWLFAEDDAMSDEPALIEDVR